MIKYTEAKKLIAQWDKGTFGSRKRNIRHHVRTRGNNNLWGYLRKAGAFNRRGAWNSGVRLDGSILYKRKNGEFLVEKRGKIVTYGRN